MTPRHPLQGTPAPAPSTGTSTLYAPSTMAAARKKADFCTYCPCYAASRAGSLCVTQICIAVRHAASLCPAVHSIAAVQGRRGLVRLLAAGAHTRSLTGTEVVTMAAVCLCTLAPCSAQAEARQAVLGVASASGTWAPTYHALIYHAPGGAWPWNDPSAVFRPDQRLDSSAALLYTVPYQRWGKQDHSSCCIVRV